jgi:hypothetical protein
VAGLLAATVGIAPAAHAVNANYHNVFRGPFAGQASCNALSASLDSPPDVITAACFFSSTFPLTSVSNPGWYFNEKVLVE